MCNLSENEGWSFAMCSMEKKVRRIAGVQRAEEGGKGVRDALCGEKGWCE